jgi:hypothetical protein
MALARVVTFEGVEASSLEELERRLREDDQPVDIAATEILVLHDPDTATSLTVLLFDNEDDYARGDAALNAMQRGDTPGSRTSVRKYRVAIRQAM